MVGQRLDISHLSQESQAVVAHIRNHKNILLSGGAGSGKTYSLVEVLKAVLADNPTTTVACITYTNAAVDEIEERVEHDHLRVSTIHDFLWDNIKHFQHELRETLVDIVNSDDYPTVKSPDGNNFSVGHYENPKKDIKYKEYVKINDGIISHDEVILLACVMYEKYEKLCAITKDSYPFIFVDEYQDTAPQVVELLLEYLDKSRKNNVIGFFGDAMQSIYPGSVGNLDKYTQQLPPIVIEERKTQNRRNPLSVITLANDVRTDGLVQTPSDDLSAPNMNLDGTPKQGRATFLYSQSGDLNMVRRYLRWDFSDSRKTKELNLTHALIANKAGFDDLMRIYDKDKVLDYVKRIKKYVGINNIDTEGKSFGDIYSELGCEAQSAHRDIKPTSAQAEYIRDFPDAFQMALSMPFINISKLYIDKDMLLDDKKNNEDDPGRPNSNRDDLIKHLFKIESCIHLYREKRFNEFSRVTDFSINSAKDKKVLKSAIEQLIENEDTSIGDVIALADRLKLVFMDDKINQFIAEREYVYQQVCDVAYAQFRKLYEYLEGSTAFSTQHKTKGAEFDDVLVVLDNGKWNQYNFKYLFEGGGTPSVLERTEKIFYVCCTRAKENLAVFFHEPSDAAINKAIDWFGADHVINLDEID